MQLKRQRVLCGLTAQAKSTLEEVPAVCRVGDFPESREHPLADAVYAFAVQADDAEDQVELDLATGVVTASAGSPVILNGSGTDFEGTTLPTMSHLHALRLRTPVANQSTVDIAASDSLVPSLQLQAGSDVLLNLLAAGVAISLVTLSATFSNAADQLNVEVLARSESSAPTGFSYHRPDGSSTYRRPDGSSTYQRP